MKRFCAFALAAVALALVPSAAAVTGLYSFTPLGSFTPAAMNHDGMVVGSGGAVWTPEHGLAYISTTGYVGPYDVNDHGVVVGFMATEGTHAFAWSESAGLTDLGYGTARAISNNGLIVGEALGHPAVWTPTARIDLFGNSPDTGVATGVGNSGRVVGYGQTPAGTSYLFTWTETDGLTVLADLGTSYPFGIFVNDRGEVAGTSMSPTGPRGFLWTREAGSVDLGVLIPYGQTWVNGLNRSGAVTGYTLAPGVGGLPPSQHAFLWTRETGIVDLGTLGGRRSFTAGIADDGTVGGWSQQTGTVTAHAFVWSSRYGMLDLGFAPTESSMVYAVNDQGWLVGTSGGYAYLWRPRDTTPPTLTVPDDVTAEATSAAGATVSFTVSAVDDVDASPTITCAHEPGSTFPLGDTLVACSARDATGNTSVGSFHVRVLDTTAPSLAVPAPIVVDATSREGVDITFSATATDLVDAAPVVVCNPASGSRFSPGDTVVRCTARDAAGNSSTASFVVHVRGAAEQLSILVDHVQALELGYGTENSLLVKLEAGQLSAFVHEVEAQSGKAIPVAVATGLIVRAERIAAVLG